MTALISRTYSIQTKLFISSTSTHNLWHCTAFYIRTLSIALPQFTSRPSNLTVNIEEGIRTRCEATGNPSPTISWYGPNEVPLPQFTGNTIPLLVNVSSLSTTGQYSCVAINSVGQSVAEFYVFVQGM